MFVPGHLQSVGWDYKPRSRLHMTLAVGGTLNPNQPTIYKILTIADRQDYGREKRTIWSKT